MANHFLKQQELARLDGIHQGLQIGLQIGCDMDVLLLRMTEVMGKDTFGAARIIRYIQAKRDLLKKWEKAWENDPEADYLQERLDDNLREAFGGELEFTFAERYPEIKKQTYGKRRK